MKLLKLLKNIGVILFTLPFSVGAGISLGMEILIFLNRHGVRVSDGPYLNPIAIATLAIIPLTLQLGIVRIYWEK